jgi:hypothetical protein
MRASLRASLNGALRSLAFTARLLVMAGGGYAVHIMLSSVFAPTLKEVPLAGKIVTFVDLAQLTGLGLMIGRDIVVTTLRYLLGHDD